MTSDQQEKFLEIRRLLREAYDDYFARDEDGAHKASEMYVEVYYPNYWDAQDLEPLEANGIGIYSYVLGPSRMHHFDTFAGALETVREWHRDQLAFDYGDAAEEGAA